MPRLRPYQEEAVAKLEAGLARAMARMLLVLPPGGGKTDTVVGLASTISTHDPKARFVMLAHRNVLIRQAAARMNEWGVEATGATSRAWKPGDPLPSTTAVVMSPATAVARNLLDLLDARYHWYLIVDEAHHGPAATWRGLISGWPGPVIGLTATPWRLGTDEALEDLFEEMVVGPQARALIDENYLEEPIVMAAREGARISGGSKRHGEYTTAGIHAANDRVILTDRAIEWWWAATQGKLQTIMYAVSKVHAENLRDALNTQGVSAEVVLSGTPEGERERIEQAFRAGAFRCLINVAIYTEGADFQSAECIMLLRPTESLALYLQQACRGMRWNGGKKTLILDATDNTHKHGLPSQDRDWSLQARGSSGTGTEPVKACPECDVMTGRRQKECPECGYEYGEDCIQCGRWQPWSNWARQSDVCDECQQERGFEFSTRTGLVLDDGWAISSKGNPFLIKGKERATLHRDHRGRGDYVLYVDRGGGRSKRQPLGEMSEAEAKHEAEDQLGMRAAVMRRRIQSCLRVIRSAASMADEARKDALLNDAAEQARLIETDIRGLKRKDRRAMERDYGELLEEGKRARNIMALL